MLVDAHCHVGDVLTDDVSRCLMTTGPDDLEKALAQPHGVYGFGVHPWFSHLFYCGDPVGKHEHYRRVLEAPSGYEETEEYALLVERLPEPRSLERYVEQFAENANRFGVIGEVGLDKLFRVRIPEGSGSGGYALSRCRVAMDHQVAVLRRQLDLAVEYGKSVSLHDVKTHGLILDHVSEKLGGHENVNICLHSYTGKSNLFGLWLKRFSPRRVFVSLSYYINMSEKNIEETRRILDRLPRHCILTETDYVVTDKPELNEHLLKVYSLLQSEWNCSAEECEDIVYENYKKFLHSG
ncbi:putative endodeoxyribonuclease RNJ42_03343 [Nakaseomyces bracarensis]|uniref:putative endodeoxyribonuclease n=1 Tax=Nakaseomyces bracarensis TaxID=273131 RepID=UPI0038729BB8